MPGEAVGHLKMMTTTIGAESEAQTVLEAPPYSTELLPPKSLEDCSAEGTVEKLSMDIAGMAEMQVFTEAAAEAGG